MPGPSTLGIKEGGGLTAGGGGCLELVFVLDAKEPERRVRKAGDGRALGVVRGRALGCDPHADAMQRALDLCLRAPTSCRLG